MGKSVTPIKSIRAKCIDCSGGVFKDVRECPFDGVQDDLCPLFPLRMGKGSRATMKSIRSFCMWCCINQKEEIRLCPAVKCALWEYRFGKRPKTHQSSPEILTTAGVLEVNSL